MGEGSLAKVLLGAEQLTATVVVVECRDISRRRLVSSRESHDDSARMLLLTLDDGDARIDAFEFTPLATVLIPRVCISHPGGSYSEGMNRRDAIKQRGERRPRAAAPRCDSGTRG